MPDHVDYPAKDPPEREERRLGTRPGGDARRTAPLNPVVQAANTLTERWCAHLGGEDYALSAAGVWPLLALLASAADEPGPGRTGRSACAARHSLSVMPFELLDVLRAGCVDHRRDGHLDAQRHSLA